MVLGIVAICACNGERNNMGTPKMSEKSKILYEKAEKKMLDLEERVAQLNKETDSQEANSILRDARKLAYDFDSTGMNKPAIAQCKTLQQRIEAVKSMAIAKAEEVILSSNVSVCQITDVLLEKMKEYPIYLEKGDKLYYEIVLQSPIPVKLYNVDTKSVLRSYNKATVKDSLVIGHSGIYLLEIVPKSAQYASIDISYYTENKDRIYNPKTVKTETISCSKGDFRAYGVNGIKLIRLFEEPRKFTLRGQLKAAFSGSAIALVAVQVPAGATDILYSMRIDTSESGRSSDGKFHDNLNASYKKVRFLGMPLYEKTYSSGLLNTLLDDNRPLRDEDAYCNMYVFRNQSLAKQFQDGTKMASELKYDVDYSTLGTQSCNGRIPTNGSKTIYLGFENARVRYTNYLWVEAEAVVPTTEYYTTKYTAK